MQSPSHAGGFRIAMPALRNRAHRFAASRAVMPVRCPGLARLCRQWGYWVRYWPQPAGQLQAEAELETASLTAIQAERQRDLPLRFYHPPRLAVGTIPANHHRAGQSLPGLLAGPAPGFVEPPLDWGLFFLPNIVIHLVFEARTSCPGSQCLTTEPLSLYQLRL